MTPKIQISLLALALSIGGAVSAARAQPNAQFPIGGIAITDGDLQIHARQRDGDGLLRDVTVEFVGDNSRLLRAKYARRDATRPNRWIFGDVMSYEFKADGTLGVQMRARQMSARQMSVETSGTRVMPSKLIVVEDGGLQLRAARQQGCLLRDVVIKVALAQSKIDPATTEFGGGSSMRIFARYARRDPKQPTHWILGGVVIHDFNVDGSIGSESQLSRAEIWTQFRGEGHSLTLVRKVSGDAKAATRIFPHSTAPRAAKKRVPVKRGFQLLAQS